MRWLKRLCLFGVVGAACGVGGCLYASYRAPTGSLDCEALDAAPEARFVVGAYCARVWRFHGAGMRDRQASVTYEAAQVAGGSPGSSRHEILVRTTHRAAVQIVSGVTREDDGRVHRYLQRHPERVWPEGRVMDLDVRVAENVTEYRLTDPPRPLRTSTLFFVSLSLTSALAWLWLLWLERQWAARPASF